MSDATYGELLDIGEKFLIEAALSSRDKLPNATAAVAAAEGHTKLIKALRANLRVFTELPSIDEEQREQALSAAVTQLAHALDAFIDSASLIASPQINEHRDANSWISAARALHGAADALRTHVGPERAHRTPDATVLDDPHARHAVVRRLAEMVLTIGEAQRRLSLRIQEKANRGPSAVRLRASAMVMLESHAGLTEAAGTVIHALSRRPIPAALASLSPALLLRPTLLSNPITAAQRSFQRIRLIGHRQARGEMPAGIDAIRAHATTASLVLRHSHAILAAASAIGATVPVSHQLESGPAEFYEAAREWDALANLTERYASTRRSPRLLHHEVDVLAASFAALTRENGRWRTPEELLPNGPTATRLLALATDGVSRLPDLAQAVSSLTGQLTNQRKVLIPTREREDVDFPYRWCPASADRAMELRAASARTGQLTEQALCVFTSGYLGTVREGTRSPTSEHVVASGKDGRLQSSPIETRRLGRSHSWNRPGASLGR